MSTNVFENGDIHTLDRNCPRARAIATRGERILAVGTIQQCREAAGPGARRIDLAGRTVLPGLADSHIHTAQLARRQTTADLTAANGIGEALDTLRRYIAAANSTDWVRGGGWDANRWSNQQTPTRWDLDSVISSRPAALDSIDGHSVWVNSLALAALGVDRQTPDPPGGRIVRDHTGEPTGILRESAIPQARLDAGIDDNLTASISEVQRQLLSVGLTSIHDIDGPDALDAFTTMRCAGTLDIRVHKMISHAELGSAIETGRATGDGDCWIRTGPVKLFTDGSLGSHTCLMSQPFVGEPGNHGVDVLDLPELTRLVKMAADAGIAVAAHAIGDEANRRFLEAVSQAGRSGGNVRLRYRSEHAQFLRPSDLPIMAALGVIASMQPSHCTSDLRLVESMLDESDLASYAWASMRRAGVRVTFGSDAPVEDPNPWHGIFAATTRQRQDRTPSGGWQPNERLSLDDALDAYTVAPAYASYEEHLKGRLRPGLLADFIALETDPYTDAEVPIHATKVCMTVVGGQVRWSK